MSEDTPRQTKALTWTLWFTVTPLLLYVLSIGPVTALQMNDKIIPVTAYPAIRAFYRPLWWIEGNTPAGVLLDAYMDWWEFILK